MLSNNWLSIVLKPDLPPLSIYLHWPFCAAICPYCDFNVHLMRDMQPQQWRAAYFAELQYAFSQRPQGPVQTVFFGGGTPSLMPADMVADILSEINRLWGLAPDAEITLEANPVSAPQGHLADLSAAGITRLSLGVQSLDDAALKFLGRTHSAADALAAFRLAREVFAHVSLDLIYARPGQSLAMWRDELARVLAEMPDHVSLYQLTIEPDTPFHRLHAAGRFAVPDEDSAADLYEMTQDMCAAAGLPAYEVSNHARDGHACRHNIASWRGGDYLGIGPGAHGRLSDGQARRATIALKAPQAWLAQVEAQGHGWAEDKVLDDEERRTEMLLLGLRLVEGVALSDMAIGGIQLPPERHLALQQAGILLPSDSHLIASPQGRLVLDNLIAELLPS